MVSMAYKTRHLTTTNHTAIIFSRRNGTHALAIKYKLFRKDTSVCAGDSLRCGHDPVIYADDYNLRSNSSTRELVKNLKIELKVVISERTRCDVVRQTEVVGRIEYKHRTACRNESRSNTTENVCISSELFPRLVRAVTSAESPQIHLRSRRKKT